MRRRELVLHATQTAPETVRHYVERDACWHRSTVGWRATCVCGWTSSRLGSRVLARQAALEHEDHPEA